MTRTLTALLAVCLVLATMPAATATATAGVYPLDGQHPLTSDDAKATFETEGVVQGNATVLDVGLTVAQTHDQANISGFYTDLNRRYLCIDYRESIGRTLRVHIPAAYFEPRPGEIDSITTGQTATFAVAENHTVVRVHFDGAKRACFPVSTTAGSYFGIKEDARRWLNNSTGWSPPSLASSDTWTRLPSDAFENDSQYSIPTEGKSMTIQFDAATGPSRSWIAVPECDNPGEQQVCQYARAANGSNASIVLMSTADTPPAVRYKHGTDASSWAGSAVRDARRAIAEAMADLQGLLGGGS